MKSTSRLRMRQDSGTRWRRGWHMLARRAAGVSASTKASGLSSTSDIRAWAQANGLDVSSRGRVSADVREAYEKAHV